METIAPTTAATSRSIPQKKPCPSIRVLYSIPDCTPKTLILICRTLLQRGYHGDSAAYVQPVKTGSSTARFYLALEEARVCTDARYPIPPTAFLDEYGTRIAAASMSVCLCEHAVCLTEHHAVEQIAALEMQ